jgi:hypothetical protein
MRADTDSKTSQTRFFSARDHVLRHSRQIPYPAIIQSVDAALRKYGREQNAEAAQGLIIAYTIVDIDSLRSAAGQIASISDPLVSWGTVIPAGRSSRTA